MKHRNVLMTAATLLLVTAPTAAQDCDCSCENYHSLLEMAEQQKDQEQGRPAMTPEMMQMAQCAGTCATAWAQCDNPEMDVRRMQEARERASQYSGQNAIEQERAREAERRREAEEQTDPGLPKKQLTAEYLHGEWCSVYGGQEVTQWRFSNHGAYEIGMPAGRGWAMHPGGDSITEFHERFDRLVAFEPDTFTTERLFGRDGRNSRKNVFTRGSCE